MRATWWLWITCCTVDLALELPTGVAAPVQVTKRTFCTILARTPPEDKVAVPMASPLEATMLGSAVRATLASLQELLDGHSRGRPWDQPFLCLQPLIPSRSARQCSALPVPADMKHAYRTTRRTNYVIHVLVGLDADRTNGRRAHWCVHGATGSLQPALHPALAVFVLAAEAADRTVAVLHRRRRRPRGAERRGAAGRERGGAAREGDGAAARGPTEVPVAAGAREAGRHVHHLEEAVLEDQLRLPLGLAGALRADVAAAAHAVSRAARVTRAAPERPRSLGLHGA